MIDFNEEKYTSYLKLIQELKLAREWQLWDFLLDEDGYLRVYAEWLEGWGDRHVAENLIWVPALGDWLEMLEDSGMIWYEQSGVFQRDVLTGYRMRARMDERSLKQVEAFGRTREMVAAKLWRSVHEEAVAK